MVVFVFYPMKWLQIICTGVLFTIMFIACYSLLQIIPVKKRRFAMHTIRYAMRSRILSPTLLKLLWIPAKENTLQEIKQLLLGCGIALEPAYYFVMKRACLLFFLAAGCCGFGIMLFPSRAVGLEPVYFLIVFAVGWTAVICDRKILLVFKKRRRDRMIKEVYHLSNQLLYYAGSSMNLHSKLVRCIPYTRTIRSEMYLLTNEWYQDAEKAITAFKHRLGTEEGYSLAETINALRLNESEHYYELLRQRIQDYKEKLELLKESRKETTSYALFILAGIPILNTFRIFVYPWIAEGQKLFNSLG